MKPIYLQVMGKDPAVKVLHYFLKYRGLRISVNDVVKNCLLISAMAKKCLSYYEDKGMIIRTGKKYYSLNEESEEVKAEIRFYNNLLVYQTEQLTELKKR